MPASACKGEKLDQARAALAMPNLRALESATQFRLLFASATLERGVLEGGTRVWFWVGPHPQYEALLKSL